MSVTTRLEIARAQQRYDRQRIASYENDKNEKIKATFAREGVEYFFQPIVSQIGKVVTPKEPVIAEKREPEEGQVAEAEGVEPPVEEGVEEAAGIVVEGQEEGPDGWELEVEQGVVEPGPKQEKAFEIGEANTNVIPEYEKATKKLGKPKALHFSEIIGRKPNLRKLTKMIAEMPDGAVSSGDIRGLKYTEGLTKEQIKMVLENSMYTNEKPSAIAEDMFPKKKRVDFTTGFEEIGSEGYQTGSGGNVISDRELVNAIKRYGGSIRGGNSSQEARDFVEKGLWALADAGQISSNLFGKIIKSL